MRHGEHTQQNLAQRGWQLAQLLLLGILLGACATSPRRTGTSPHEDLRFDTETASRWRHASAVRSAAGPLAASSVRAMGSKLARLAPIILTVLESDEEATGLEERLVECARQAERQVNSSLFGDRPPTRQECRKQVGVDNCGNPITQAMELGRRKHVVALACAKEVLTHHWPAPFSIEQRYRFHEHARLLETISPEEEKRLIDQDCTGELWRTIKPDIVLHGDPDLLRAVLILDFKFPCPDTNEPRWARYSEKSAFPGSEQGLVYQKALGGEALLLTPRGLF